MALVSQRGVLASLIFVHVMQAGLWYACNICHLSCVDLELKKVSHMSSYYAGAV